MKKAPAIQSKPLAKAEPVVQKKLKIGKPNDKHEQQADAVADQVMKMPDDEEKVSMSAMEEDESVQMQSEDEGSVQMQPEEEESVQMQPEEEVAAKEDEEVAMQEDEEVAMQEEEEVATKEDEEVSMQEEEEVATKEEEEVRKKSLAQRSGDGQATATPALASQLSATKGGGRSLPKDVNQEMSQKIGSDFSNVRVHTDSKAAEMNDGLGAKAFAHGNDVYFNKGNFNPSKPEGKKLLAHELTHVVQQKGKIQPKIQKKSKGSNINVVPIPRREIIGYLPVQFDSTTSKPKITIELEYRPIICGRESVGTFLTRVDNATRTDVHVDVDPSVSEETWQKKTITHTMNNAMRHTFKIIIEGRCSSNPNAKQLEVRGKITRSA